MSQDAKNSQTASSSRNGEAAEDYPLTEVPVSARAGLLSLNAVLLGFTFFTATMFGGGKVGVAFRLWPDLVLVGLAGNLLLGTYVAALGWIAYRSGLNAVLLGRFAFGDWGSKFQDALLGFTQIGWYAWGTATIAIIFTELLKLDPIWKTPLMLLFGFGFCVTAYIGYRGLDWLARISVPLMTGLILWSMGLAWHDAGGWSGLAAIVPTEPMTMAAAITIIFGTFASGGTQATNWTRFARSGRAALVSSFVAFFLGNGLMIFSGAFGALVYQESDVVQVLAGQGILLGGLFLLFFNIWTTQDNTIYNFSVAGCNLLRTERRRRFTLGGAALGTVIALLGMYDWLEPYLLFLGTAIPPLGGAIMADFWFRRRREGYPPIASAILARWNVAGLLAYAGGVAAAALSPGVAPLNGIVAAFLIYGLATMLARRPTRA
jgi:cytosine permease